MYSTPDNVAINMTLSNKFMVFAHVSRLKAEFQTLSSVRPPSRFAGAATVLLPLDDLSSNSEQQVFFGLCECSKIAGRIRITNF